MAITRYGYARPCRGIDTVEAAHPVPDHVGEAATARMLSLMISDAPGDDPAQTGSGPTVGDATTPAEARAVLARWNIAVPEGARMAMSQLNTVVAPGDERLSRVEDRIIAAPSQSLAAAAETARAMGVEVRLLGDALEGEARDFASRQAQLALRIKSDRRPGDPPLVVLSGGELTVTRTGGGVGGPNAEFCLALARELDEAQGFHAPACDTDGVDGAAEGAGARIAPDTLAQAACAGLDQAAALADNDAHRFFEALGDQVITGPTLTNVNDFRAILIQLIADSGAGRAWRPPFSTRAGFRSALSSVVSEKNWGQFRAVEGIRHYRRCSESLLCLDCVEELFLNWDVAADSILLRQGRTGDDGAEASGAGIVVLRVLDRRSRPAGSRFEVHQPVCRP